ncbi:MAG: uracil phosphoribosyltransferase [Flavobacteriaceae bacterium]|nr:uracil phosphoribosyltransferase [Bacteroidia bacterium]MBT8286671.1 uracil phosphoribosyltransferase [Bacteroidia bacterium]NNF75196.1 uracil phosphoribosyltransferase [Flavobacteriaceae bacterium]NNK72431.1 uracil phosphoribosyltransferase [Flavobacteriaceae bacterium]
MEIHILSKKKSILNTYLEEIRSEIIQKDRLRFRTNISRITQFLCYEMSQRLQYHPVEIQTGLGIKKTEVPDQDIVVCSILRAGLTMHQTILNCFDQADNAFISAYRKHDIHDASKFEIIIEYLACPNLNNKTLILADPMLASGQSCWLAYEALLKYGKPKQLHILSVIASKQGLDYLENKVPEETHLWLADLDPELNDYGYIVPGLGDAGDLSFGIKLQH